MTSGTDGLPAWMAVALQRFRLFGCRDEYNATLDFFLYSPPAPSRAFGVP